MHVREIQPIPRCCCRVLTCFLIESLSIFSWSTAHKTASTGSGGDVQWAGFIVSPNGRWLNFSCRPESSGASCRAGDATKSVTSWVERSLKRSLGHRMTTTLMSRTLNEKSTIRGNMRAAMRMASTKLRSTIARRRKIHKIRTPLNQIDEAEARLKFYIEQRMLSRQRLS